MDKPTEPVDNLGNAPDAPDTPNVSDPSPKLPAMTGLVTETHLLTSREVCDLLHIGRTTLWEWRQRGEITGMRHRPGDPKALWYYPANQPVIAAALRAVSRHR